MYHEGFRCKVTGTTGSVLLANPSPPVWFVAVLSLSLQPNLQWSPRCEDNPANCVKGAKQMLYWQQLERNNIEVTGNDLAGSPRSPAYNNKCGFTSGLLSLVSFVREYLMPPQARNTIYSPQMRPRRQPPSQEQRRRRRHQLRVRLPNLMPLLEHNLSLGHTLLFYRPCSYFSDLFSFHRLFGFSGYAPRNLDAFVRRTSYRYYYLLACPKYYDYYIHRLHLEHQI